MGGYPKCKGAVRECTGEIQEPGPPVVLPYTRVYGKCTVVFGLQCHGLHGDS